MALVDLLRGPPLTAAAPPRTGSGAGTAQHSYPDSAIQATNPPPDGRAAGQLWPTGYNAPGRDTKLGREQGGLAMADCLVGSLGARSRFATLASPHISGLLAAAEALTAEAEAAEALVLDTLDRSLRRFARHRTDGDVRVWLFGELARTHGSPLRRATRRLHQVLSHWPGRGREAAASPARPEAGRVRAALGRLPSRLRMPLVLCDVSGFSYAQIAEILEWPHAAVRARIGQGRRRLGELLGAAGASAPDRGPQANPAGQHLGGGTGCRAGQGRSAPGP